MNNKFFWSDTKICHYFTEEFLNSVEDGDNEAIKALFAPNALSKVDDMEKAIMDLLEYYQGEHSDFYMEGPMTSLEKHDGHIRKQMDGTYDVSTDKGDYRIAIRYVHIDTLNPDNVGIWYVYIIKVEDDPNQEYAYWGDGKETPGINIGLVWPE